MIYRMYEIYEISDIEDINKQYLENIKNNECFICYEFNINEENKTSSLHQCLFYVKKCTCDGYIHKKCLNQWLLSSNKCPICRSNIFGKDKSKYNIFLHIIKLHNFFTEIFINLSLFLIFTIYNIFIYISKE
jgi:hypothetical protein